MKRWMNWKLWGIACIGGVGIVVAAVLLLPGVRPTAAPSAAAVVHGKVADALDAADVHGQSIDFALARLQRKVAMPDLAVVGEVEKVVVDDMDRTDPKDFGLLVRYSSGVKLKVEPGHIDMADALEKTKGATVDGSAQPYRVEMIAGRTTWVADGGIQKLESGAYQSPTLLTWNSGSYTYTLEAGSDSVSLEDLKVAAESIR